VLYRLFYNCNGTVKNSQLVLPSTLNVPILELIHADAAGHLKFAKCFEYVQRRAYWYRWQRDSKLFIECYGKCSAFHRGSAPKQGRLNSMLLGYPTERCSIDLCGPSCLSDGYKYIFTATCHFSKFVVTAPIRNKEAATVAKCVMGLILCKSGLCFEVLTDQGPEF